MDDEDQPVGEYPPIECFWVDFIYPRIWREMMEAFAEGLRGIFK